MKQNQIITVGNEGRYNFHNVSDMRLRLIHPVYLGDSDTLIAIRLTPAQAARVQKHYCGIKGCGCGSAPRGWEENENGACYINFEDAYKDCLHRWASEQY